MSTKLVPLADGYLVTWLDNQRVNQWALISADGQQRAGGPLGETCVDNHCGAALVQSGDWVHAVTGGHHSPLAHLRMPVDQIGAWQRLPDIDARGTYPCLVADAADGLHLAFRSPDEPRWTLQWCSWQAGGWTPPRVLVTADRPGYIYWTNSVVCGSDGCLHLVFGNTRQHTDGALTYGASWLASDDHGATWHDLDGWVCPPAVAAADLPLLPIQADWRQSAADVAANDQPGPLNVNYHQVNLSNAVCDEHDTLWVVQHGGADGSAVLARRSADGDWSSRLLLGAATETQRWHQQSSLMPLPGGGVRAVLMAFAAQVRGWGSPGTYLQSIVVDALGQTSDARIIADSDATCASWLPAQPPGPEQHAPVLYTRGRNAGGFDQNHNHLATEVMWLPGKVMAGATVE